MGLALISNRCYNDIHTVKTVNKGNLIMKKILAILAMAVSTGAFAATATVEYQNADGVQNTPTNQEQISLSVKEEINKNFAGDVSISNKWNNSSTSNALNSSRVEGGLTGTVPLVANVSGYTRVAVGQKFTTTTNYSYYSVEPGVSLPLGAGFTGKVGYRFRSAFDAGNNDTTRTARALVTYQINKDNTVGVGYDSQRGDSNQNIVRVNYTRGF